MDYPVRCWTCGKVIGHLFLKFEEETKKGKDPKEILDGFGLNRFCCRRMLISHVDIISQILEFSKHRGGNPIV